MDLMIERGIRLRKDIGPYLVGWKEDSFEDGKLGDEALDEVELEAADYRRLLPYQ
jgi:hypothetical protein